MRRWLQGPRRRYGTILTRGRSPDPRSPATAPAERPRWGRAAPSVPGLDQLDDADRAIVERALPFTMTGVPRLQALVDAVRHCERARIPGAFAECGVWRGGSVLAMILTFQELGSGDRDIYLYDTFEGMTEPTEHDVSPIDPPALETWRDAEGRRERALSIESPFLRLRHQWARSFAKQEPPPEPARVTA